MSGDLLHLANGSHTATFRTGGGFPELLHLGHASGSLPHSSLFSGAVPPGGLDSPAAPNLVADPSSGWFGEPGILLTRNGAAVPVDFRMTGTAVSSDSATFTLTDDDVGALVEVSASLGSMGVLKLSARLTNTGDDPLGVATLSLTVSVPGHLDELVTWGGRHAMEFCEERTGWGRSVVTVSSRRGRTSHQQAPTVFAVDGRTGESTGQAVGLHLAWSGNHRIVCDAVNADRRSFTAGEILAPGEIILGRGDLYATPDVLVAASDTGLGGVSRAFHGHLRAQAPVVRGARPIIVNTWEAVYFDHDTEKVFELARRAARVGAERFVLDDGWFLGRRDDTAGLGDWEIDPAVWPEGLGPLAEHVQSLGMEFGIWVEPEMVNPRSHLYRTHPEWVLGAAHQHEMTGRNQLVLDLSRADVRDHLVERLGALLGNLPVAHVKWDHNRDVIAHGSHFQTRGLLDILGRLRAAHPDVQFESCASGGGRVDAGIAEHVVRFWTSDSIDALDRLDIQRGAVRVIPPEMLGAHIGAPVCHTTGRRHPLSFRALSALPFWLGIEWDLLSATDHELERLAEVVAVHKRHRALLHSGTTWFGEHPDISAHVHAVVADDKHEALVVISSKGSGPRHLNAPVRIPGLESDATYTCSLVPLGALHWALNRGLPVWVTDGATATGAHLESIGLPWPPLLPESGVLVHLERTS